MKVKDQDKYDDWRSKNTDGYGKAVFDYAERWAESLERAIEASEGPPEATINALAKSLSHEADTDGITGFMYGCAVSVLAHCWEHGDALRRWHNLDCQIHDEGERANENGGVLNPAVLTIG